MSDADDSDATQSAEDLETEDEGVGEERAGRRAQQQQNRSRATSPSASAPSGSGAAGGDEGFVRLTARQRARMEKEAGLAEDVAWHEMELLPKLTYSWKGRDKKDSAQLTEQEWLKRQETLERRRMRSLREKREAEEAVKAKIRRAVTARFRGKLGVGGDSGLDGQGGGDQEGGSVRPGWVKMRYTAEGVSLAWHPAAHPLSLPVAVVAVPDWPLEPVDLLLQPSRPGEPWQAPPHSSSSVLKAGCALTLQPCSDQQQQQQQGEVWLQCVDSQGWVVGCLRQQDLLEALEFAGHPQPHQQQLDWQQWRAVVRSIRRGSTDDQLAAALIMSLTPQQLSKGLVTCSTGNHALAFMWACSAYPPAQHAPSTIYLPTTASPAKVSRLQAQGAHLCLFSDDCALAEIEARRVAGSSGCTYISPYNDWEVMAGQGTVAVELLQQLAPQGVDAIIVPVGGGGLIGGIAAVVKAWNPDVQVIGVQPAASDVMRQSVAAGRIVDAPSSETLSDATAGGIEEGAITLDPCVQYVDTWVTVSEQEIADAMVSLLHHHSKLVEGAAACGVAAAMRASTGLAGKRVGVVCCGGNVAVPVLRGVLDRGRVCE